MSEIQDLELTIAARQADLRAAQGKVDAARRVESERAKAVRAIDTRIAGIAKAVHHKSGGVYVSG